MSPNASVRFDSRRIAAFLIGGPLVVLLGWQLKNELLIHTMVPNTAACFVLCGLSLFLFQREMKWTRPLALACAGAVLVFAAAILSEHIWQLNWGVDGLLFHSRMDLWYAQDLPAGRFARNTSIGFVLSALGLIFLHLRTRFLSGQILAIAVFSLAYLAFVGHLYRVSAFYSAWMSKTTATGFVLLSMGMLFAETQRGISGIVLKTSAGGFLARRLLLLILFLLPFLGMVRMTIEKRGFSPSGFISALLVLTDAGIQVGSILLVANALNKAEERRENAEIALRRGEKLAATGRFAATIAHEMNNPLAAVVNLIYLAQSSPDVGSSARPLLEAAQQELKRVAHISRQTLAFYKDNASADDFDVAGLLNDILFIMQAKIRNKSLVIETRFADCSIHGVKGEVRQVVSNLISNAIDASHDGGIILLRAAPCSDSMVCIEVSDSGPGISAGDLKKLYQPFFTTKADVGNGLGLWVSKNLVEKNAGTITVTTSTAHDKSGTTFMVNLPVGVQAAKNVVQPVS